MNKRISELLVCHRELFLIGDGNDERIYELLTLQRRRWAQCVKIITLTNTASLVKTIIRWDIGMTRKCVSTTSAVRTVQGKVEAAHLRMMISLPEQRRSSITPARAADR